MCVCVRVCVCVCVWVCVCVCNPVVQGSLFPIICVFVQGAVTEFVRSLPTKTLTFSGDALEDVPVCTCNRKGRHGHLIVQLVAKLLR